MEPQNHTYGPTTDRDGIGDYAEYLVDHYQTNPKRAILHILLAVITGGLWASMWVCYLLSCYLFNNWGNA